MHIRAPPEAGQGHHQQVGAVAFGRSLSPEVSAGARGRPLGPGSGGRVAPWLTPILPSCWPGEESRKARCDTRRRTLRNSDMTFCSLVFGGPPALHS
ncbi:hypothetical protein CSOJ01_15603 [Colletotrichum sojae]|uniref:Uncharacterized protein n=1 Tax=Colletotrichum sojae TaxID=2175907 RepID=A0A8H6MIQ7_9PEZI|nr:hypothetical protein CSOJ01_15603 [Colletotrichum sojae]